MRHIFTFVCICVIIADLISTRAYADTLQELNSNVYQLQNVSDTTDKTSYEAPRGSTFVIIPPTSATGQEYYQFNFVGKTSEKKPQVNKNILYSYSSGNIDPRVYSVDVEFKPGFLVVPFKYVITKHSSLQSGSTIGASFNINHQGLLGTGTAFVGGGVALDSSGQAFTSAGLSVAVGYGFDSGDGANIGIAVGVDMGGNGPTANHPWIAFTINTSPSSKTNTTVNPTQTQGVTQQQSPPPAVTTTTPPVAGPTQTTSPPVTPMTQ